MTPPPWPSAAPRRCGPDRARRGRHRRDRAGQPAAQRGDPSHVRPGARGRAGRAARRAVPACRSWSRTSTAGSPASPTRRRVGWRRTSCPARTPNHRAHQAHRRGDRRQDQHARARPARRHRARAASGRRATRGTRTTRRAARAAARPRLSRRARCRWATAAMAADRSASRRGVRSVRAQADARPQPARPPGRRGLGRLRAARRAHAQRARLRGDARRDGWPRPRRALLAPPRERPYARGDPRAPRKLRIAFATGAQLGRHTHPDVQAAVRDAAALCASLGHELEEVARRIDRDALVAAYFAQVAVGAAAASRTRALGGPRADPRGLRADDVAARHDRPQAAGARAPAPARRVPGRGSTARALLPAARRVPRRDAGLSADQDGRARARAGRARRARRARVASPRSCSTRCSRRSARTRWARRRTPRSSTRPGAAR